MTTKEYMQCVTAVDGEWLAELGPMFFSVKESYKSRLAKRHKEDQEQTRMAAEMAAKRDWQRKREMRRKEAEQGAASHNGAMSIARPGRDKPRPKTKRAPRHFGM